MLIKVKRDTIRKNPDAGKTEFIVPGRLTSDTTKCFTYVDNHIKFQHIEFSHLVEEHTATVEELDQYEAIPALNMAMHQLRTGDLKKVAVYQELKRDCAIVRSLTPAPAYLFQYEDVQVECTECHEKFLESELKADSIGFGDSEQWSNQVCPKCGAFDCCEIEYENIADIVKELNL